MRSGVMEAGEVEDEGRRVKVVVVRWMVNFGVVMVFGWWWGSGG